jgi:hypothetical protein
MNPINEVETISVNMLHQFNNECNYLAKKGYVPLGTMFTEKGYFTQQWILYNDTIAKE